MNTIDEYLETVTPTQKQELQRIRDIITKTVPEVQEKISYNMPTFTYKDQTLILFSAFKNHMSLFGAVKSVEDKLKDEYEMSGRGTLQFTEDKPLSEAIITELITTRRNEIDAES